MDEREVRIAVDFSRPADRLRMKGQVVRITDHLGGVHDYRVAKVSMPDEFGRVEITATPAAPATA